MKSFTWKIKERFYNSSNSQERKIAKMESIKFDSLYIQGVQSKTRIYPKKWLQLLQFWFKLKNFFAKIHFS